MPSSEIVHTWRPTLTLDELTGFFKMIAPRASALNAVVKFDFGEDGVVVIDATKNPADVSNDDRTADATISATLQDFSDVLAKKLSGDLAFLMGKLRISGDKVLGVKLTFLFNR